MTPPRLARAIVALFARRADCRFVLSDLDEEFARHVAEGGAGAARRWYWRQALTSALPLAGTRLRSRVRGGRRRLIAADDWRQAARSLARRPRTAACAALTLALALGAAGAAGVIVYGLVVRPLPYRDEGRVVHLWPRDPQAPPRASRAHVPASSFQDIEDLRRASRTAAAVSAYVAASHILTRDGVAREVDAMRVGRDFDRVLGVVPALGRAFVADNFSDGAHRKVLLTASFWRREFGGSPAAVGQSLVLDDRAYEIVGVLPDLAVPFPPDAHDIWVPLIAEPGVFWQNQRGTGWLSAIARVRPEVSVEAAESEWTSIALSLRERYPDSNEHRAGVVAAPIRDAIAGDARPVVLLLAGAIGAVLLVAAGNVTNLLLAQAEQRRREFAIRQAVGAAASRLRAQIVVEMFMMAAAGAAAGAVLVPVLIRAFLALYPEPLPAGQLALSPGMLAPLMLTAGGLAAVLALPQIAQARRFQLSALQGSRHTGGPRERRMRAMLIAGQVAFSVVLLACGIAFARTAMRLASIEPGFRPAGVLTLRVVPSGVRYANGAATRAYYEQVLAALEAIPGVRSVAMAIGVPFVSTGWSFPVTPPGGTAADRVSVRVNMASPGFYETLGIPITRGRALTGAEQRADAPAAIINEAAVRLLPGSGDPVGQRVPYSGRMWEIVGVVGNVRDRGLQRDGAPWLVLPWSGAGRRPQTVVVRADGDPMALAPEIRRRLAAIDPLVPVADIRRLDDVVDDTVAGERFRAVLVAVLAAVAMVLSALGVYSVTAYAVARGRREHGVRLALGAPPSVLMARVLAGSLRPALAGAAFGGVSAWLLAGAIQPLMHGVEARDPRALAAVVVALVALAVAAGIAPAVRAGRIDPVSAMKD